MEKYKGFSSLPWLLALCSYSTYNEYYHHNFKFKTQSSQQVFKVLEIFISTSYFPSLKYVNFESELSWLRYFRNLNHEKSQKEMVWNSNFQNSRIQGHCQSLSKKNKSVSCDKRFYRLPLTFDNSNSRKEKLTTNPC